MIPEDDPHDTLYKKEVIEMKLDKIDDLETEVKRLNSVVSILESKFNQLRQKFNAHRDKLEIHVGRSVEPE